LLTTTAKNVFAKKNFSHTSSQHLTMISYVVKLSLIATFKIINGPSIKIEIYFKI